MATPRSTTTVRIPSELVERARQEAARLSALTGVQLAPSNVIAAALRRGLASR